MFPRNVFPITSEINDAGHLVIGGCDAVDLAAEFGTPLYIFDEATLRGRCRSFVREFTKRHPNTTVAYASKAYVNPAVAQIFASEGLGTGRGFRRRTGSGPDGGLSQGTGLLPR